MLSAGTSFYVYASYRTAGCQNLKTEFLGATEIQIVIKYNYSVSPCNSSLRTQVVSYKPLTGGCNFHYNGSYAISMLDRFLLKLCLCLCLKLSFAWSWCSVSLKEVVMDADATCWQKQHIQVPPHH